MSNFQMYAQYYDLLNRDKDYTKETDYIDFIIKKFAADASTILELGSGTGTHAINFAKKGYSVHGVDRSEEMLVVAHNKREVLGDDRDRVQFTHADIRNVHLDLQFDVVVSLFHVMSYQAENSDLEKGFATANNHLHPGGIFLFDFWHGSGVLTDQPAVRIKRVEDGDVKVYRLAEPVMHISKNIVDVHYEILIMNSQSKEYLVLNEVHSMRYLFLPELKFIAGKCGFEFIDAYEYLTTNELNNNSWNGCIILKKVSV